MGRTDLAAAVVRGNAVWMQAAAKSLFWAELRHVPASIRFISAEPLLGPLGLVRGGERDEQPVVELVVEASDVHALVGDGVAVAVGQADVVLAPPDLRAALSTIDRYVHPYTANARLRWPGET
jgi:hypothetical protein